MIGKNIELPEMEKTLIEKSQQNAWLKFGGVDFLDGFLTEGDYKFEFIEFDNLPELEEFFNRGNWAIRSGVVYGPLCFINQVNGGDEWWTLKLFEGGRLLAFESISFKAVIKEGKFISYMERLLSANYEDCKNLNY